MRRIPRLLALLAIILTPALASAQSPQHVHYQLLADVSTIAPGKPFHLGVRLTIDPGWHVYWTNPGDAGLPTRVKFSAPDGFSIGPVQFPAPQRIEDPGNIVMFGYENSVLLTAEVTPPAQLPLDATEKFSVLTKWLVCSDVCIPGQGEDSVTLPVSAAAAPANTDLFNTISQEVPVEIPQSPDVRQIAALAVGDLGGTPRDIQLIITWKQSALANVQLFPNQNDVYNIGPVTVDSNQNTTQLSFKVQTMAGKSSAGQNLSAVIGYDNQSGQRRGVIVSIFGPNTTH
jgi:DsbC/DsbD-like thiol-disulfide interchange protein